MWLCHCTSIFNKGKEQVGISEDDWNRLEKLHQTNFGMCTAFENNVAACAIITNAVFVRN